MGPSSLYRGWAQKGSGSQTRKARNIRKMVGKKEQAQQRADIGARGRDNDHSSPPSMSKKSENGYCRGKARVFEFILDIRE